MFRVCIWWNVHVSDGNYEIVYSFVTVTIRGILNYLSC